MLQQRPCSEQNLQKELLIFSISSLSRSCKTHALSTRVCRFPPNSIEEEPPQLYMVSQQCSLENFPDLASYGWFVVEIENLRPLNVMKLKGRPLLNHFLRFPFGILSKQNKSFCSFPFFFLCGFALKRSFVCKQKALAVYPHTAQLSAHGDKAMHLCYQAHIHHILATASGPSARKMLWQCFFFFLTCMSGFSDQFIHSWIYFLRF